MNNQSKAVSIILYLIWPFSAVLIGIKNFDSAFGRKLLIAAFVFLGYTAIDSGDLERYAAKYYELSDNQLGHLVDLFVNLQIGKFFTEFTAILLSIFDNHHVYFAFLFGFYGYFLINAINLIRISILKKAGFPVLIGFITFAFFYSILTIFNYAFYTGAIYFLYFLLKIVNNSKKRYYSLILFTPLFHIGLGPLLLVPIFFILFGQRTKLYVVLLILFTILSQSFLLNNIEAQLSESENVFEKRYNAYGSEEGRERMDTRYSEGYESGNFNYRIFRDIRKGANYVAIPLMLSILFINKRKLSKNKILLDIFNVSIACMAITNLMLNISQGERFFFISGFMVLGAYVYYIQTIGYRFLKFKFLLFLAIPCLLLNNLVSLILVKNLVSGDFILTNFPYLLSRLI